MLFKKIGARNYFVAMIILLGITVALVVTTFILTALIPGSMGEIPYEYETRSACDFEPWAFEIEDLQVYFPEGGVIVNIKQTDRYRSDLLLGDGSYTHEGEEIDAAQVGGLFMVTENSVFEELRGGNIFRPLEDGPLINRVARIGDNQKGLPVIWKDTIPVTFHAREGLVYYYFVSPGGEAHLPPAANYSQKTLAGAFMTHILFIAIMGMVLTMLSPDHRYSRYWIHLRKTRPRLFSLALIPILVAIITAGRILPVHMDLPVLYAAAGYALVIFILFLSAKRGKIDYLDLGLRPDRIRNGYLLAIVGAVLIVLTVRGFPAGVDLDYPAAVLQLPVLFFTLALPAELVWRGYIQAFLSRRAGIIWGLTGMAFLVGLSHFIYLAATEPWLVAYPYTYLEAAVLVPGTAVILGYLYLRTENIMACAVMHSLIIWLPGVLLY